MQENLKEKIFKFSLEVLERKLKGRDHTGGINHMPFTKTG